MTAFFRNTSDTVNKVRPAMKRYRSTATPLSRDQANRQGDVSKLAFETLGRDDAVLFLNTPDEALGGRPIDVAIASAEGAAIVKQAIGARGTA